MISRVFTATGIGLIAFLTTLIFCKSLLAYDATFNFTQLYPELVAGWKIKAGPTKGGSYPHVIDCKKPAPKVDGSYDCIGVGLTANPIYAVAVNYNTVGVESAQSAEATMSITVPPPADFKIVVKIITTLRLRDGGRLVASKPVISKESVPLTQVVVEGTKVIKRNRTEYTSTTTFVM